jgi:hypothetical protein
MGSSNAATLGRKMRCECSANSVLGRFLKQADSAERERPEVLQWGPTIAVLHNYWNRQRSAQKQMRVAPE